MKRILHNGLVAAALLLSPSCAEKTTAQGGTTPESMAATETSTETPAPIPSETAMPAEGQTASEGIQVGNLAPDFSLPDEAGKAVRLSEILGERGVLLAFYPADFTGG